MKVKLFFRHRLTDEEFKIDADVPECVIEGFARAAGSPDLEFTVIHGDEMKSFLLYDMQAPDYVVDVSVSRLDVARGLPGNEHDV